MRIATATNNLPPPDFIMQTFLTPEEILQLVTTGMVELTDDLILRMVEDLDENTHTTLV